MWGGGWGSALTVSHSALTVQKGKLRPRECEEYVHGDSAHTLQSWDLNPCHSALETAVSMGHLLGAICVCPPRGGHHEPCASCVSDHLSVSLLPCRSG